MQYRGGVSSEVRAARPGDATAIFQLIRGLAEYEREPDAVRGTAEQLRDTLFGGGPNGTGPAVFAHVAEDDLDDGQGRRVVGIAVWWITYSTWEGRHGIHLEDLFVLPEARGRGHGLALIRTLAALAVERDYARLEWAVLDWNRPAIDFYDRLGAESLDEWITRRLHGKALRALGEA